MGQLMYRISNPHSAKWLQLPVLFLSLILTAVSLAAPEEEEFLRPEQAFILEQSTATEGVIELDWRIADGYYLYQQKFRANAVTDGVTLGELQASPAETKQDPIFGEVQVHYGNARLSIPVEQAPADIDTIELKLRYQGCADKGICYPPQVKTVAVPYSPSGMSPAALTAAAPVEPALPGLSAQSGPLEELGALSEDLGLGFEDDILSPEQAFRPEAESPDGNVLLVRVLIAEGTYLYQDKLKVRLGGEGVRAAQYRFPQADIKKDSIKPDGSIGDVAVYHDEVVLEIPLLREQTEATEIEVLLNYQGCADRGICYPPQKKTLTVALPAAPGASAAVAAASADAAPAATASTQTPVNEQDQLLGQLQTASLLTGLLLSLGFGILVAFTACMYPMIPILSSLIMGHGEKVTPGRAFELSLAYTQGIALTFGVLGAIMAVVGKSLGIQSALQTPWVLVPSAILFVGLALSMFGFYQIQMPAALQSRLHEMSNRQKGGSLLGVGLMGVLSALIVGPCGGPVLLAVLAFAAQSQDMMLGFIYLWLFGTGMGLPLLLMGSGGGALLPKAGTWMDIVKATGGVIMLALALSFLERMSPTYIPTSLIMLLWGTLMISVGVYMGALTAVGENSSGWFKLWKGLGLALLVYGVTFLVGVAAGSKDTNQPLKGIVAAGGSGSEVQHLDFIQVKNVAEMERRIEAAAQAGQPVMLDFYADWCTYCKVMEKEIFPDPGLQRSLSDFVLLQADITRMNDEDKALTGYFELPAPPALFFWDRQGKLHRDLRLVGQPSIQQIIDRAEKVSQ